MSTSQFKSICLALAMVMACAQGAWAQAPPSPTVQAVLELPRTEPAHYFAAVMNLIDLGQPELAKPILEELASQNLTDEQRAGLVEEFGAARFMKLSQLEFFAPKGGEFADACLAAASARANDPRRINQLVGQIADASPQVRQGAIAELKTAGTPAIKVLVDALTTEQDADRRTAILQALANLQPLTAAPVLAMLACDDPRLQLDAIRLVADAGMLEATPILAGLAVAGDATVSPAAARVFQQFTGERITPARAEQLLATEIAHYRGSKLLFVPDAEDQIELWHWDRASRQFVSARYAVNDAALLWADELAQRLAHLQQANEPYQRLALLLGLEASAIRGNVADPLGGLSTELQQAAKSADARSLNQLLADALDSDYHHAAIAAIGLLATRNDAGILYTSDGQLSPLAEALRRPHRQIRFAALQTVIALNPQSPFPGSSGVTKALAYFAGGTDARTALVGLPNLSRAADLAGQLQAIGFETQATNRGRDLVRLARQSADLDMILVDMNILDPAVREVVYELRSSTAAGATPIGLLAADGRLDEAQRLADQHEGVVAWSRPHRSEDLAALVETLDGQATNSDARLGQRTSEAAQSLQWMAQLLNDGPAFYDVLPSAVEAARVALYQAELTDAALAVLTAAGTPVSQNTLLDYAGQRSMPVESRRKMVDAFAKNVQRNGLLLTTQEIYHQYDRYNDSASADADTQQILGQLLDTIESRRSQSVSTDRMP